MEPQKLLEGLFDRKRMILVKLFLDHPEQEYGIREAARLAKLAPATSYRIIRTLLKMEVVEERRIKKLRLYRMAQNRDTKFLDELLAIKKTAIEEFVELASHVSGVTEITQIGKPSKDRVVMFVIREEADPAENSRVETEIGRIETEIKAKYKFSIHQSTVSHIGFERWMRMNEHMGMTLQSEDIAILYRKEPSTRENVAAAV